MEHNITQDFVNPPAKYRGMPFWAWNTRLDSDLLEEQVKVFKEMGMGGYYLHTRVGLDTPYLGTDFMNCVKQCVALANRDGMRCGLYDEDRWPSGYGGGYVTRESAYRCKSILITPYRQGSKDYAPPVYDSRAAFHPQGNGLFLAAYEVKLGTDGCLEDYRRCEEETVCEDGYHKWYAYLETAHDSPWFNNQAYLDTMSEEAVQCFIKTVYETYYNQVGDSFGKTIPSIFTDEPQFTPKGCLGNAFSLQEVMLPFTTDFAKTYQEMYGEDLMEYLPELIWELPEHHVSVSRYRYHDHAVHRFSKAYSGQVGAWCRAHGISLGGHMMEEPTLLSQTRAIGEVMRSLKEFSLPGIDMLCDAREYTTAKQAQSICHQYGKEGMISELYGVTNWDFDFRHHKLQGDWQAALGVTQRVHHLSWMSMNGEAKRDYPAAIGSQSPWYESYALIEDHFARVNVVMEQGTPVVKIGVIHPIESYWTAYGPSQQTSIKRQELDEQFQQITQWLLFNQLDFDYISESLIPDLWGQGRLGLMEYDVVLVPGCVTVRGTTLQMLADMKAMGKTVVFMGNIPRYVDAVKQDTASDFAKTCRHIPFSQTALVGELEHVRVIDIRYHGEKHLKKPNHKKNWDGERAQKYIYQMRKEENNRWLFIANGKAMDNPDLVSPDDLEIKLAGQWKIEEYDTATGAVRPVTGYIQDNNTVFYHRMYEHDSLLLKLSPTQEKKQDNYGKTEHQYDVVQEQNLFLQEVEVIREEPNVLLMDIAEYSFDGINWKSAEEVLRIDTLYRKQLGYPLRMAAQAQPWIVTHREPETHPFFLKFHVYCDTAITGAEFALEDIETTEIWLDGKTVEKTRSGCYVDRAITKILLPELETGAHELCLKIDFCEKSNVEACYLLGDFYVKKSGFRWILTTKPEAGGWCSLTEQGLPFYGGNVSYTTGVFLENGFYELQISKFCAPLVSVFLDNMHVGDIVYSPYKVRFEVVKTGIHQLSLRSFGSRINTFGAVHDCDEKEIYFDPNAWRTEQESWSYEYQLKSTGILKAPVIHKIQHNRRLEYVCDKV